VNRVQPGPGQDLRGIDIAQTGEPVLAQQPRFDFLAAVRQQTPETSGGELAGGGVQARRLKNREVVGQPDHPEAPRVHKIHHTALEGETGSQMGLLRRCGVAGSGAPEQPSGHPQVNGDPEPGSGLRCPLQLQQHLLAQTEDPPHPAAANPTGGDLAQQTVDDPQRTDRPPGDQRIQLAGHGLHFRQLGHQLLQARC